MIPACLIIAYKLFPHTRFGRSVTLIPSDRGRGEGIPDQGRLKELEGQTGTVMSALRPVGTCDFSGRRVECVAESGYIDKGTEVRVIRVEGSVVTVRKV
jgi:membrane-bound serine protease (ClpP class)